MEALKVRPEENVRPEEQGLAESPVQHTAERCWRGFEGGHWQRAIDVRDFIVRNLTPYEGDESFLVGPSPRSRFCSNTVQVPAKPKPLRSHNMASDPWMVRRAVWNAWKPPTHGMGLWTRRSRVAWIWL